MAGALREEIQILDGNGELRKTNMDVLGICCPSEVPLIYRLLQPLPGVRNVSVNVTCKTVTVMHDPLALPPSDLVNVLNQARLDASLRVVGQIKAGRKWPSPYTMASGVLLGIALFGYYYRPLRWTALGAIAVGVAPIILRALAAIRGLVLDVNALMLIAVAGAIALGDYVEGGTIVFLFTLAEWLESRSADKARMAISAVMNLAPLTAVIEESGEKVPVESVQVNTILAVKAGETIPIDGVVVSGRSSVDESSLTGESMPVDKDVGATVWAGTINRTGYISVKTVAKAEDSAVAKMVKLVEEAQNQSSRTEQVLQRFAKYYTPVVVAGAVAVAIAPLIKRSLNVHDYVYKALVLLVSACPCALVISTPVATACGLASAARLGLLIKGGQFLEALGKLKTIAFDKTGTLTEGQFRIVDIHFVEPRTTDIDKILCWISSLEKKSSHPMAMAVVSYCRAQGIEPSAEVMDFAIVEGEGISGVIEGQTVCIGNARLKSRLCWTSERWDMRGATVSYVAVGNEVVAGFSMADHCRPQVLKALHDLKKLGLRLVMLTGDTTASAAETAKEVGEGGIEIHAELLPEDKLKYIREMKRGGMSAMVGDGINDGPALAAADVGIAMGVGGSAVAIESADIALMSNDLAKIASAVRIGRRSLRTIYINVAFSLLTKAAVVVLALFGYVHLWMAVLLDVGTCLLVTFHSMLLLHAPKKAHAHSHSHTHPHAHAGNGICDHPHVHESGRHLLHEHAHDMGTCDHRNEQEHVHEHDHVHEQDHEHHHGYGHGHGHEHHHEEEEEEHKNEKEEEVEGHVHDHKHEHGHGDENEHPDEHDVVKCSVCIRHAAIYKGCGGCVKPRNRCCEKRNGEVAIMIPQGRMWCCTKPNTHSPSRSGCSPRAGC